MSNLNPAGKPAQTPRAASAKIIEYVCINPYCVCDLDCHNCQFYVPVEETVSMRPDDLVTEPVGQVEAGVTKCNEDDCISPPIDRFTTVHKFAGWDDVDAHITAMLKRAHVNDGFDIARWRFTDNPPHGWIDELCFIPAGLWIEVESRYTNVGLDGKLLKVRWEIGCKVEAVEAVEVNYHQPELASTTATASTTSTYGGI